MKTQGSIFLHINVMDYISKTSLLSDVKNRLKNNKV